MPPGLHVFTEELLLADNLINERSICSPARQEIRDCRNRLHQPGGASICRRVNPKGRREATAMEVEGLSRCDAAGALKPKGISGVRCVPRVARTRITHTMDREGREKGGGIARNFNPGGVTAR